MLSLWFWCMLELNGFPTEPYPPKKKTGSKIINISRREEDKGRKGKGRVER